MSRKIFVWLLTTLLLPTVLLVRNNQRKSRGSALSPTHR